MTALATTLASTVSTHSAKALVAADEPRQDLPAGKAGRLMSDEERSRVKLAIANATSSEEVARLERTLKEGYMPVA